MSKAEGKKIAIKFTQPLIGDVTANLSAFRVSGQEYKHVGGPLLNKTYTLASITRHPPGIIVQNPFISQPVQNSNSQMNPASRTPNLVS